MHFCTLSGMLWATEAPPSGVMPARVEVVKGRSRRETKLGVVAIRRRGRAMAMVRTRF